MAIANDPQITPAPRWPELRRGWLWVGRGWEQVNADRPLWLGMSLLYLVVATILSYIPFAGFLLVVMFTPALLGGALLALHQQPVPARDSTPLELWLRRPLRQLLQPFATEDHVFAVVLLGIVTLGLVVMVRIGEYMLGIGSVESITSIIVHRALPPGWLLLGIVIGIGLNVLLVMALLYVSHRTLLANHDVMMAIHDSFKACMSHGRAIVGWVGIFIGIGIVIMVGFYFTSIIGYLLLYTVGLMALPVLVCASYQSYRDIFDPPPPPL